MTMDVCQPFADMDQLRSTIFQQNWWLQIARGSASVEEVQVLSQTGVVVGRIQYIVERNVIGIPLGRDPRLTRVGGPIVSDDLSDADKSIVLAQLIEKLPNISFMFTMSEHTPNAHLIRQAFKYAGFECFEQLNYSQSPENIANSLGKKLRAHVKQASNKLDVIDIDPVKFINFYQTNLLADDKRCYFPLETARDLIATCIAHKPPEARIIAACKKVTERPLEQPVIDAAICIVWDDERCYYWLSTRRSEISSRRH